MNYGLTGRCPKLPKRKLSTKKTLYSKCVLKSVELFNPEPMPYQTELFKPCTVSRLVDLPRRIYDGFTANYDIDIPMQRGVIIHKDRYDWSHMKDNLRSQNERLAAEENFIKRAKYLKNLSEQKQKSSKYNLILEGENLFPANIPERSEIKKERHFNVVEEDSSRQAAPTMNTNYNMTEDILETIDSHQPVSMDVHGIKLKSRIIGGENVNSAPAQSLHHNTTTENMPNMYIPPDGRDSFDRLPPIFNKQRDLDQRLINSGNSHTDFEYAFRQSERFNRPNVRLNEYVIDGVPIKFMERADIQAELRYLKSLALPTTARDLFVGRGIHLPSTHATKNPRRPNISDGLNYFSETNQSLKFDTPGGGSVTINSKTPPKKNFAPGNSPMPKSYLEEDKMISVALTLNVESNNEEKEWSNEIFNSLDPNSDRHVDTVRLVEHINGIEALSDKERELILAPFAAIENVSSQQFSVIMNSVDTIIKSNPSFRESLSLLDMSKIKSLQSHLLILLDQSEIFMDATSFYEFVIESLNLPLTINQCREAYTTFLESLESTKAVNNEKILRSHILLFIPFILKMAQDE